MKRTIVLIMALILAFSAPMFAKTKAAKETKKATTAVEKEVKKSSSNFEKQMRGEDVEWTNVDQFISGNPLGLAFSMLGAHYEFNLDKGTAIGLNAFISFWGITGWSSFGLGVGGEYNFYFQKHAPNGWFAGPGAGIQFASFTYLNSSSSAVGFNINGHGGYRWIWDNGFLVDVTGALGFTIMGAQSIAGVAVPYGGFGPSVGASIGYAWK